MIRSVTIASVLLVASGTLVSFAQAPLTHTKDSFDAVKENLKSGKAVLVDVREPKEWDEGHLKGAISIPKSKLEEGSELAELVKKLSKDQIVYTHCRAGARALACGEILKKQGFDVRPLKAGFADLVKAGFEKAESK